MSPGDESESQSAFFALGRPKNSHYAPHCHDSQMQHEAMPAGQLPLFTASRKQTFLSALPSLRSRHMMRNLSGFTNPTTAADDDGAASEWETIIPTDEFASRNDLVRPPTSHHPSDDQLVFHAQGILTDLKSSDSLTCRRNTVPGSLGHHAQQSAAEQPLRLSLYSSSSLHSDVHGDDVAFSETDQLKGHGLGSTRSDSRRRPVTLGIGKNIILELGAWRHSKVSNSTLEDPFKYDGATYSAFLQPAPERGVSNHNLPH